MCCEYVILGFDLLGFESLANVIESKYRVNAKVYRMYIRNLVKSEIDRLRADSQIKIIKGMSTDDAILAIRLYNKDLDNSFVFVHNLLRLKNNFLIDSIINSKIKYEIALGIIKYSRRFHLISIDDTKVVEQLKLFKKMENQYKRSFKINHNNVALKQTYIIITEVFFKKLSDHDKKYCKSFTTLEKFKFYKIPTYVIHIIAKRHLFITTIGLINNRFYRNIDWAYEPPKQLQEIKDILISRHFVIIFGPQEIGKTCTAIRILWEFFTRNYHIKWNEEEKSLDCLLNIRSTEDKTIICCENPFESQNIKLDQFKSQISSFLDFIKTKEDIFVIITSRRKSYEEFKKSINTPTSLSDYEVLLDIGDFSYDFQDKIQMLKRHVEVEECVWLFDTNIKQELFGFITINNIHLSPLRSYLFASATRALTNKHNIIEKLLAFKDETEILYSKIFNQCSIEEKVFLTLLFIFRSYDLDRFRLDYNHVITFLNVQRESELSYIIIQFKEKRIIEQRNPSVEFSHSSFIRALELLIFNEDTEYSNLFRKIVNILSKNIYHCIWDLPILLYNYFNNIDNIIRQKILEATANQREMSHYVGLVLDLEFEKIPTTLRIKIIESMLNLNELAGLAIQIIFRHNKFPQRVNQMVLEKSRHITISFDVLRALESNFHKIDPEFRFEIINELKDQHIISITDIILNIMESHSYILGDRYDNLLVESLEVEGNKLLQLSRIMLDHFNSLHMNVRNRFINQILTHPEIGINLIKEINDYIERIDPLGVLKFFFHVCSDEKLAPWVLITIDMNPLIFQKYKEYLRGIFNKIRERPFRDRLEEGISRLEEEFEM